MTTITHVWIVNRTEEYDPIYAFVDEEQAREYGARFPDAVVTEEVLMDHAAGAAFLVDTYEPDDEEPDDHSTGKEDMRTLALGEAVVREGGGAMALEAPRGGHPPPPVCDHTPGPWGFTPFADGTIRIVVHDTHIVIADCPGGWSDENENWANAFLILAAPDLLAAAKAVSGWDWDRDHVHLRALRAAITKATGEAPGAEADATATYRCPDCGAPGFLLPFRAHMEVEGDGQVTTYPADDWGKEAECNACHSQGSIDWFTVEERS